VKSWLLSTLRAQYAAGGQSHFVSAAPHAWILWEPGSWKPPQRKTMVMPIVTEVVAPGAPPRASQPGAEALVIALENLRRPVVLGRHDECDLFLNDATLSARHLAFHLAPSGWAVEDLGSTNGTRINGERLAVGTKAALDVGARVQAGQVLLTFTSSEALWPRLASS
jgi:pSer/pThr/pTyr-binding forkhead associated (FHA) protein